MLAESLSRVTFFALVVVVTHEAGVAIPWNRFLLTGGAGYTFIYFAVFTSKMIQELSVQQTVPWDVAGHTNRTSYGFIFLAMTQFAVLHQSREVQLSFAAKWTTQTNLINRDYTLYGFEELLSTKNRLHRMMRSMLDSVSLFTVTFRTQIVVPADQTNVPSPFKVFNATSAACTSCINFGHP